MEGGDDRPLLIGERMPPTATPSQWGRWLRGLGLVVLVALILLLLVKVLNTVTLFGRPGEMTWGAAACAQVARRVQQGGPVYADWELRPHVVAVYGPMTYVPVAWLGRWLNAEVHGLFIIGRWISLLSVLGTSVLIVWVLRFRRAVEPAIAVAAGLMFLTADDVLARMDITLRPDAPACFLTVLGLSWVVYSDRPLPLYGSVLPFLLAFLYKLTSVAGPLAVVLWLAVSGKRRQASYYAALTAALFLGVVVLLNAVTHGRYVLNNVEAIKAGTTLTNVPTLLIRVSEVAVVPMAVGVLASCVEWASRRPDLVTVALGVSLLLAIGGTCRDGSDVYYYMTPLAIACVLSGRLTGHWWKQRRDASAIDTALAVVLCLAVVRYVPDATLRITELPGRWKALVQRHVAHEERARSLHRLAVYLNALPGPVLSQFGEVGLLCPNSVLTDSFMFTLMSDAGTFDDRPLVEAIREGKIMAIVLNPQAPRTYQSTDMFSRRWLEAMRHRYRRVHVPGLEWAEIYRPVEQAEPATGGPGSPSS